MTTHRFFVPAAWLEQEEVTIIGPLVHRLRNVLRLTPGDHVVLLDNSGWEHEMEITAVSTQRVEGRIVHKSLATAEPRTKITLYQALLKLSKFERVLEQTTELGIVGFVPMITERCIIGSLDDISKAKTDRWWRILIEAAELSRRGRLPTLRPALMFHAACEETSRGGLTLIPWEEEKERSLRSVLEEAERPPFSINLFIGPEGGFTEEEVTLAQSYGALSITLGPRILRAETAGLVTATALFYALGDLEQQA
jgi:16S rRNA (uracil1498-N3)-methyltransferase